MDQTLKSETIQIQVKSLPWSHTSEIQTQLCDKLILPLCCSTSCQIDKSVSRCTWYRQLRYSSSFRIFFTFYKCPVILVKPGKRKTARIEFPLVLICKSTWIRPDYQKSPRDWSSRNSGVTLFYLMKLPKMSSVSSVKGRPLWLLVLNMMWIYMWQAEWWLL